MVAYKATERFPNLCVKIDPLLSLDIVEFNIGFFVEQGSMMPVLTFGTSLLEKKKTAATSGC